MSQNTEKISGKNGFKIPTFAIYFFDGSPYPFCCFDQEETMLKAREP